MATHDYIISNASGASVRADLNNALAAIVSNNSNATSPATTYAYQWWADTTTGQLKLRNSANSAWITIFELDGTMLMEDGTVSAPGLAFASDLNTGFFRSAADKINFATGGAERLEIGSSEVVFNDPSNDVDFRVESNGQTHMLFVDAGNDRIGIGKSSPRSAFELGIGHIVLPASGRIGTGGSGDTPETAFRFTSADNISAIVGNNEKFRIDNSGRLLVGTTSNRLIDGSSGAATTSQIQVESTGEETGLTIFSNGTLAARGSSLNLGRSRGTSLGSNTVVASGDTLGAVVFNGADGTDARTRAAQIIAQVDGTPGSNDMPGRLVFSTTADGASTPTERLRINNAGNVGIGTSVPGSFNSDGRNLVVGSGSGGQGMSIYSGNSSYGTIYFADGTSGDALYQGAVLYNHSSNFMRLDTAGAERLRIDSSGNVGIGLTPNTHNTGKALEIGAEGNVLWGEGAGNIHLLSNAYYNAGYKYASSAPAGRYNIFQNTHTWARASSGTADAAATFTESMRLDSSGRLLINTSTSTGELIIGVGGGLKLVRNNTGNPTVGQSLMSVGFHGVDSTNSNATAAARIEAFASENHSGTAAGASLKFYAKPNGTGPGSNPTNWMTLENYGTLSLGNSNNTVSILAATGTFGTAWKKRAQAASGDAVGEFGIYYDATTENSVIRFHRGGSTTGGFMSFTSNDGTERLRINNAGHFLAYKTGQDASVAGFQLRADYPGLAQATASNIQALDVNRLNSDGDVIIIRQDTTPEGSISVSGTTVSYNGGHLSRWSQLAGGAERTEILRGSVLSNLDEMCEWAHAAQEAVAAQDAVLYTEEDELPEGVSVGHVKTPAVEASPAVDAYTEDNEQLNRMKVSDVEGDPNVAGVFQAWDDDDDTYTNDFYCAMTGDFVIRIAQGTTVARGDLLMSAGDGTAKPQDDDIVRSKTIAKVTSTTVSTTYSDGSYCVPCVLMAC